MKSINKIDKIVFNILKESNTALIPSRIHYLVYIIELKEKQMDRTLPLTWTRRGNFYFSSEVTQSLDKLLDYRLVHKHFVRELSNGNPQYSYEVTSHDLPLDIEIKSMISSLRSKKYFSCKISRILALIDVLS